MIKTLQLLASARRDGWFNTLTGLGVKGRDKRLGADFIWKPLTENEAEHLYASDKIARRIVDVVPKEGTRKWIEIQIAEESDGGQDLAKKIVLDQERLKTKKKVRKAWNWARLYGGAGIFMAVDDGRKLHEPLELANIRSVLALTVLNRHELSPHGTIDDLSDPNFGDPEFYTINPRDAATNEKDTSMVHHTRIVRFEGAELPRNLRTNADDWGDSELTAVLNSLRNFNQSHDSAASAAQDFRINVLKLKNLANIVAEGNSDTLTKRIETMNLGKSVLNSILLDSDSEEYENKSTNFTGLEKLLERINDRLVADTGLPHTIILGDGATGNLSGKGESEERNFKSFVGNEQEEKVSDGLDRILEVSLSARKGPTKGIIPESYTWKWNPIWQPSDKEVAEVRKIQSDSDKAYIDSGVLDPDEVATSRFGGQEYSIETTLDMETRAQQAKLATAVEKTPDGPTPDPEVPKKTPDGPDSKKEDGITETREDRIVEEGGEFCVKSKTGSRSFGCFPTKAQAQKRLGQVEFFKRRDRGDGDLSYHELMCSLADVPTSTAKMVITVDGIRPDRIFDSFGEELTDYVLHAIIVDGAAKKDDAETVASHFAGSKGFLSLTDTRLPGRARRIFTVKDRADFDLVSFRSLRPEQETGVTMIYGRPNETV